MRINNYSTKCRVMSCALRIWVLAQVHESMLYGPNVGYVDVPEPDIIQFCGKDGYGIEEILDALSVLGAVPRPPAHSVIEHNMWKVPLEEFTVYHEEVPRKKKRVFKK